jgi:hypothetical protein
MGTAFSEAVPNIDFLAAQAERAGLALACPFSSSDEFDAAVIRAHRAAGIYGPRRHRWMALLIGVAVIAIAVTLATL